MNQYVTGSIIKKIREERKMTQSQLAQLLCVSDKSISKWETGRGYPDISLIEPLAKALQISVIELLSGQDVNNTNRSFNMKRMNYYVCPICGNIITSVGNSVVSCCGVSLVSLQEEEMDEEHICEIEEVEDEYYIRIPHEMSKHHYISFIAAKKVNGYEFVKLYPESEAQARFKKAQTQSIIYYCNRHGLFKKSVLKSKNKI